MYALVKAVVLAPWLSLPPLQHYLGSAQEVSDCQRAVLGCHMEADMVCNQRGQKVQLQSGQGHLVEFMAVAKEDQHITDDVVPCAVAVCCAWSVQLKSICAPVLEGTQLLGQGSSSGEMLFVLG